MEHQFAEPAVEGLREPPFGAVEDGQSPVDDGVALVIFPGKPWKAVGARAVWVGFRDSLRRLLQFPASTATGLECKGCRTRKRKNMKRDPSCVGPRRRNAGVLVLCKPVHYLVRWKSSAGDFGPWSETVIATVGA
jgi:hypothetical protein